MSIASEITRINNNISAAYTACSDKGATMPQTQNSANLADTIGSIPTGGGAVVKEKDVNFYDYDGTLLYSYTKAEALALSALPALPSQEGLVCQGWNYTLSQIQAQPDLVNIGCQYDTADGATKFYLRATKGIPLLNQSFKVSLNAKSTASVDWGDGTVSTLSNFGSSPSQVTASHTYSSTSEDTLICISISGGSFAVDQTSALCPLVRVHLGSNCIGINNGGFKDCWYLCYITIPNSVTAIGKMAFYYCSSLFFVSIPTGVTSISEDAFRGCDSLNNISIPSSVAIIDGYAFCYCHGISNIAFPEGLTSLSGSVFQDNLTLKYVSLPDTITTFPAIFSGCKSLETVRLPADLTTISASSFSNSGIVKIALPSTVTSIGNGAFSNCKYLLAVDMSAFTDPAQIPTLSQSASSVFYAVPGIIYVANAEMLSAFSAATNWSSLSSSKYQIKGA